MRRRLSLLSLPLALLLAVPLPAQDVVKRVGSVTFSADPSQAFPGGLVVVRLSSRRPLGAAYAILDGRRVPFYLAGGPRALVPIPLNAVAGPTTLGVEILGRRGRQRIPLPVTIAPRVYPARSVVIPEGKRALLKQPTVVRDGRHLLSLVRTENPAVPGALRPPVTIAPGVGFGSPQTWVGGSPVESMLDSLYGEGHRGRDYEVPAGTVVTAPAAGTVLFAASFTLAGNTVVIDHGQGVVSALFHLQEIAVRVGDGVQAGERIGLSGDTGIAPGPQVHWRTYLHGIGVDPEVLTLVLG
ncbi:MAG TPA: M23 family metallopeptidase [Vicinamibacteria bacterium]|jgi:murein DD-endopeptidase MepM/ murein hydrolase activator NlpD